VADNKQETPYSNNLFSNHFLQERLNDLDDWKQAEIEDKFEELQELWEKKKDYLQNEPNEDNTQEHFIDPILTQILDHYTDLEAQKNISGETLNPDYLFFENFNQHLDAEDDEDKEKFGYSYALGDAKRWDRKLDKSASNNTNPAFQIYNYVDRLRAPWGVLTNGKKWRLYSYEDCEADTYYEIDIVENILKEDDREKALQNFKYFYLFFRQESFLPKEQGFLDKVFEGSVSYSKGLEEDLEDKIYTALEVTARGFFDTNDLEKTEENADRVHRASLIFLYRFLFILNAESRGLLPIEEDRYEKILSLEYLKDQLDESDTEVFGEDEWAWNRRIQPLFEAIDQGEQYGEFEITAYNGGLFDEDNHQFLAENKLQGNYIREILKLLTQSEDKETEEKVLVDYRDLNIRHLGSVYEGLLEHEIQIADENLILKDGEWESAEDSSKDFEEVEDDKKVAEDQPYLTNESGERKATGSYYTPEYIVEHIVENTVGPKVDEKLEEAEDKTEVLDKVLELNVCDPAMGSGHFLTEATSYMAHKIVEHGHIEEERVDEGNELVWVKRQVVKEAIYGVDINPLAVELGKLSLWIETMSKGKPLSFLDHHLKVGNSLVGTDLEEIKVHPDQDSRDNEDLSDFGEFIKDAKGILEGEYSKIERQPEETVEQVHEKEEMYRNFLNNSLYENLQRVADVHTHQYFAGELPPEEYQRFIGFIYDDMKQFKDQNWFQNAQKDADQRHYFHWELEFPKIFFGEEKGFDSIIGNPPYISTSTVEGHQTIFDEKYESAEGKYDVYNLFVERSLNLKGENGLITFILPNKFIKTDYGEYLRSQIGNKVDKIIDFRSKQIFNSATTYTCILRLSDDPEGKYKSVYSDNRLQAFRKGEDNRSSVEDYEIDFEPSKLGKEKWEFKRKEVVSILSKIDSKKSLGKNENIQVYDGLRTNADTALLFSIVADKGDKLTVKSKFTGEKHTFRKGLLKDCLKGSEIDNYYIEGAENVVFYPYDEDNEPIEPEELEENYPDLFEYLNREDVKEKLEDRRGGFNLWYELTDPRTKGKFEDQKIVVQTLSKLPKAVLDDEKYYFVGGGNAGGSGIRSEEESLESLNSLVNSNLSGFYLKNRGSEFNNNYYSYATSLLKELGAPEDISPLTEVSDKRERLTQKRKRINVTLQDYLGNYSEGKTLNDLYTPASGVSDKPVSETSEDREKLQVGSVQTEKNGDSVTLLVSARYKPENEAGYDTDRWGYTETELYPAMEFHDLSETEAALIEEFVPVAVDEAGGFADFRSSATKTKSLIDRLKSLKLPKVSDVEDDLQKFIEQKEKAEELEEKIEKTDQEINEIVYDLYDLTEEEIEIVEESVSESQA
jgi:hypothetical protein